MSIAVKELPILPRKAMRRIEIKEYDLFYIDISYPHCLFTRMIGFALYAQGQSFVEVRR